MQRALGTSQSRWMRNPSHLPSVQCRYVEQWVFCLKNRAVANRALFRSHMVKTTMKQQLRTCFQRSWCPMRLEPGRLHAKCKFRGTTSTSSLLRSAALCSRPMRACLCFTCSRCRKRRLFAQQDLNNLIKDEGLEGVPQASLFALDVFDNTDYESRLPSEWVPKTSGRP